MPGRSPSLARRDWLKGIGTVAGAAIAGCRGPEPQGAIAPLAAPKASQAGFPTPVPRGGSPWPAIPPVRTSVGAILTSVPEAPAVCDPLFASSFLGGFECSTFLRDDRHLDLTKSTRHDELADDDYGRLTSLGMFACRDGVSWPVSEPSPGKYDFSRALAMQEAANRHQVQVVWDLCHYGWPHGLDIFSAEFPERFRRYARAFIRALFDAKLGREGMIVSPINEISFFAWAGGDRAFINPFQRERSFELKFQLLRAAIEAMRGMREIVPSLRFIHCDPIIHVAPRTDRPKDAETAEDLRRFQFQAWDILMGRSWKTQLGGSPDLVDVVGVNYYRNNQRFTEGDFIEGTDDRYRPLADMLIEIGERYGKPVLVAETGAEGDDRAKWLEYVAVQCADAMRRGCPLHGITWYPILNHPGWTDDRHIHNGVWDYADAEGHRPLHVPVATLIRDLGPSLDALRKRTTLAKRCAPTAIGLYDNALDLTPTSPAASRSAD